MEQFCNQRVQDILLKCKKPIYEIFETEVQPINYQISLYTSFQDIQYHISNIGFDKNFYPIYSLIGIDISAKHEQKLKIYFIKIIEQIIIQGNKFKGLTIVFFNKVESSQYTSNIEQQSLSFYKFRKMIKSLPLQYFARINQIYLCFPDFSFSSFSLFKKQDILNQLLNTMIIKVSSLTKLVQKLGPLLNYEAISKKVTTLDKSFQYMFVYCEKDKRQAMEKLQNLVTEVAYPDSIQLYQTYGDSGIPKILVLICQHFKANQKFCKTEYIFRRSCGTNQLKKIQQLSFKDFDEQKYKKQLYNFDSITLCTFVKHIFSQLKAPLFNFQTYQMIINQYSKYASQREELEVCPNNVCCEQLLPQIDSIRPQSQTDIKQTQMILIHMEPVNREIFFYIVHFLRDHILKYEFHNLMSPYSLAVTFSPCFFRAKKANFQELLDSQKLAKFLDSFFNRGMIVNIDF